jgi:hypothetical protein
MEIKVNKDNWSADSKRSSTFNDYPVFYEGLSYSCCKCGCSAVFTAEEQKETFEVKKHYIDQKRDLCGNCYNEYVCLKESILSYESHWKNLSETEKETAEFLNNWFTAVNKVPSYGKPKNESIARMLFKLTNKNA